MRTSLIVLLALFPLMIFAQAPAVIKITNLEERLAKGGDTTYIVSFWATWCKPCVEELPDLEKINSAYADKKVKVLLVSMDFPEDIEKKVVPFLQKWGLKSEVVVLDEVNGNYFIPKVHTAWTGAIPATLIRNSSTGMNEFFERKITYELLDERLKSINR
jgi:thiol-disulfide isomerase/thioredoxin